MKFDMHCHTRAGSIDGKVPVDRYIELLKSKGFDGMLITDHDSYRGYRKWLEASTEEQRGSFCVLAGIEYDTKDAGHFLVIMPDNVFLKVLRIRGMSLEMLTWIVHRYGGVLGPAHPFGTRSSSAMFFKKVRKNRSVLKKMDFVEGFNTCEKARANRLAQSLARNINKPCIGGSDSHEESYIGMAFTEFEDSIKTNNDLIKCIKNGKISDYGGTEREYTKKAKHKEAFYGVWGFKAYNRGLGFLFTPYRRYRMKKLIVHGIKI